MLLFRKHIDLQRLVAIMAASTFLSGCVKWQTQAVEPMGRPAFDSTKTYRLTLQNGERRFAEHPVISGDSLTWTESSPEGRFPPPKHHAISLSEISFVEVMGTSVVGTIVVVWLAVGALAGVINLPNFPSGLSGRR